MRYLTYFETVVRLIDNYPKGYVILLYVICYVTLYLVLLQWTFCPLRSTNYWKLYTYAISIVTMAEGKLGLNLLNVALVQV